MKLKLTIDQQPLILDLQAILVLFGKPRTIEFAEGKWTPFVFCEPADNPAAANAPVITAYENVERLNKDDLQKLLNSIPEDVMDFGSFIRKEIERIEKMDTSRR